ncbi:hypothetical protein B7Y94_01560 [Candidatus Saccharibacteria bacterium 32-49-12]|nr:MAG: hypothetical protein B7Y94_01560 [Candidatus Saccharibacteria bacterium 32-49-12]
MPRKNYPSKRAKTPHIASTTPDMVLALDLACHSKRRYPSQKQALDAAEVQMLQQPSLKLRVYNCQICGKWHLTRASR